MTLQSGDTIPLTLKLWDGDTGKYVKAVVVDSDGITLGTITLTHITEGFYQDDSLTMPNKEFVTVYYIVYDDIGLTTRSVNHQDASEVFALTPLPLEIVKKVDDIIVTVEPNDAAQIDVTVMEIPETVIDIEVPEEREVQTDTLSVNSIEVETPEEITITEDC